MVEHQPVDNLPILFFPNRTNLTPTPIRLSLSIMEKNGLSFFMGISLVSAATISLEISLTRYLSIAQNYHFAFLVVSLAFLGYGASGTFLTLSQALAKRLGEKWLCLSSSLFGLSILASFLIANSLRFDFLQLPWDRKQILYLFPFYLCLGVPFFFAGAAISFGLARWAKEAHRIYFFDLLGAGMGCLLAATLFLPRGEKGVFLVISGMAMLSSVLFSYRRWPLLSGIAIALFATEAALFFAPPTWLSFRLSPFKALPQAMKYPGAQHCLTRFNPISRVDVISSPAVRFAPGLSLLYLDPLPPQLGISVDGGELTAVTAVNSFSEEKLAFLSALPSNFPYCLLERPKVLVLEPGGGLDVVAALRFNASQVKSIESNPLLVSLLRQELSSFSGQLYNLPNVTVVSAHPREALKKESSVYDLIVFGLPDVFGSAGTGLYGIGENYLYTVDSFVDILNHLTADGMVSQTMYLLPPPRQEAKMLSTWCEALERKNLDPALHLAAIRTWGTLSFFIKKNPYSSPEINALREFCRSRLFDTVYFPGIRPEETNVHNQMARPVYEELFSHILDSSSRKAFLREYLFEISPASDNRPFFHDFYKWGKWRATYETLGRNPAFFFEGRFLLLVLLAQAVGAALIFIALPLGRVKRADLPVSSLLAILFFFSLLGAAFMFIEITLIQKFILFLGHPLYSFSGVVFAILFSSGLGSLSSKKVLGRSPLAKLQASLLFLAGLGSLYLWLLTALFDRFIGHGLGVKIILSFGIILPLGFLMGFPFPTGIRLLQEKNPKLIPWAWSANAFSTVIHSVLAHLLALSFGYAMVLVIALSAYLGGIPLLCFAYHRHKANA